MKVAADDRPQFRSGQLKPGTDAAVARQLESAYPHPECPPVGMQTEHSETASTYSPKGIGLSMSLRDSRMISLGILALPAAMPPRDSRKCGATSGFADPPGG